MTIALLVVSVLSASAIARYHRYAEEKVYYNTVMGEDSIRTGIENYFLQRGAYPCPADPTLTPEDADYGKAQDCTGGSYNDVMNGMVPVKDLGIPMEYALDGWDMKYEYAVTRGLTDPATFDESKGSIFIDGVSSDDGVTAVSYAPSVPGGPKAHYVVLSHGENMVGAYSPSGTVSGTCASLGSAPRELENCNRDNRYFYQLFARSLATGATYLDDMIIFNTAIPSRIWVPSEDGKDLTSYNLNIGIGTDDPQYALDVVGNIRGANADVVNVCEGATSNCFDPYQIAGKGNRPDALRCRYGESGATDISYSAMNCNVTLSAPAPGVTRKCPDGSFVVGASSSGQVECAPLPVN